MFTRTGFNMPSVPFLSSIGVLNYKDYGSYLGFIPSSYEYYPISSILNIPDVYGECEDTTASTVYFGISTSNTAPVRGRDKTSVDWSDFSSRFQRRKTPEIIGTNSS